MVRWTKRNGRESVGNRISRPESEGGAKVRLSLRPRAAALGAAAFFPLNRVLANQMEVVNNMANNKTAEFFYALRSWQVQMLARVQDGSLKAWEYQRHVTRRRGDYCPFQCPVCDELRVVESPLNAPILPNTPVL